MAIARTIGRGAMAWSIARVTRFDPGLAAIQKLAMIVLYAAIVNMFFVFVELVVTVSMLKDPGNTLDKMIKEAYDKKGAGS